MALIKSLNGSSFWKMMLLKPPDFEGVAMPKKTRSLFMSFQLSFEDVSEIVNNDGGLENYRPKLISISYTQSPDTQGLPVSPGEQKGDKCGICSKTFSNWKILESHMRSHLHSNSFLLRESCKKIKKLLERDSITWTEEGNGQIKVIRIDEINPKRLRFAKKPTVA